MVRHYVAKRGRSGKGPDRPTVFLTKRSQFGCAMVRRQVAKRSQSGKSPDWLIAFFTKRSQFAPGCLITCSKIFSIVKELLPSRQRSRSRGLVPLTAHTSNTHFTFNMRSGEF